MTIQFDMFGDETRAPVRRTRPLTDRPSEVGEVEMVRRLEATGRYRVLQKLEPRPLAAMPKPGFPLRGVIIDTETTGLSFRKNEVIEVGAVAFSFDAFGAIGDVIDVYGGLQQPSGAIPAEITTITGITDEMVAGQVIDRARLEALVADADLIVAHNAGFDRPFCEALSAVFCGQGMGLLGFGDRLVQARLRREQAWISGRAGGVLS